MSAQMLFEQFPKSIYFWTFTWIHVHDDWEYGKLFNEFAKRVKNIYPFSCGLKVVEVHPGEFSHGLHVHLIVNQRLSIQLLSRIGRRYGLGRISVEKCNWGVVSYLAKYLTKRGPKVWGIRKWGTWGPWRGVRTNNIVIDSPYMRSRNRLLCGSKVTIGAEFLLRSAFDIHGHQGMALCFEFLKQGKTASACLLVNSHVELTKRGGLRYVRHKPILPFRVVRDKQVTT